MDFDQARTYHVQSLEVRLNSVSYRLVTAAHIVYYCKRSDDVQRNNRLSSVTAGHTSSIPSDYSRPRCFVHTRLYTLIRALEHLSIELKQNRCNSSGWNYLPSDNPRQQPSYATSDLREKDKVIKFHIGRHSEGLQQGVM